MLDGSLAVSDAWGSTLAVAARSPADERALLARGSGVEVHQLRVADNAVGTLVMRVRGDGEDSLRRLVVTLIASEVERVRAPERISESASGELLRALAAREVASREEVLERAGSLAPLIVDGASIIVARAHQQAPAQQGWRGRMRALAERGARAVASGAVAALNERDGMLGAEVLVLVPTADEGGAERAAEAVAAELGAAMTGFSFAIGRSRVAADPADLVRACGEALLAANVAQGAGDAGPLAFEQTGAYRLLLSAMSENPGELERFYEETVEPLVTYDEQYETELVKTLETFLEADGNVAGTAQRLFTHRHTVYYRLERVRELSGLDVSSSDGREKLSLGLKSMRVLGIPTRAVPRARRGPPEGAFPGAAAGAPEFPGQAYPRLRAGGSSNGRTSGFGPENRGSNPCPPTSGAAEQANTIESCERRHGPDPRCGPGDAHALGEAEGLARDLRAPDDRVGDRGRAQRGCVAHRPRRLAATPTGAFAGDGVEVAVQPTSNGTGGATVAGLAAGPVAQDTPVLVVNGDVPLVSAEALRGLLDAHAEADADATVATAVLADPSGYGRVVRDATGLVRAGRRDQASGRRIGRGARDPRGKRRHIRLPGAGAAARRCRA